MRQLTLSDTHMMIDCETLSTSPLAIVLSVGWCIFNGSNGILHQYDRHMTLKIPPQEWLGRVRSEDTEQWWNDQPADIRWEAMREEFYIPDVMSQLHRDWNEAGVQYAWAHSPAFDYVLLDSLFRTAIPQDKDLADDSPDLVIPWDHRSWLDTRTLMWLTGEKMPDFKGKHNALQDAINQAEWVMSVI